MRAQRARSKTPENDVLQGGIIIIHQDHVFNTGMPLPIKNNDLNQYRRLHSKKIAPAVRKTLLLWFWMNLSILRKAVKSGIRCLPAFNELLTFVHYRASSRRPMQCKFIKNARYKTEFDFFRRLRRLSTLDRAKRCVCMLVSRRCTFSCNFARPLNPSRTIRKK